MREMLIILFIIIAIFGGGIYSQKYIENTSNDFSEELESLKEETIQNKDMDNREKVKISINNIEKKWEELTVMWSMLVVHQELDNIENALVKAKSNIENGNLEVALQEIETAIFFVNHVKDRENTNLKNIF